MELPTVQLEKCCLNHGGVFSLTVQSFASCIPVSLRAHDWHEFNRRSQQSQPPVNASVNDRQHHSFLFNDKAFNKPQQEGKIHCFFSV